MNFDKKYDFESWESDYELYDKEDWVGLLKLRETDAKKHPSDLYAQQRYAEALTPNKKYKETLEIITPFYRENYEVGFGICEILDALYGLDKTEEDFNWVKKPIVLKLDSATVDFCVDLLRKRRRAVQVSEIYGDLIMKADYCKFNESELAKFLVRFSDVFDIQLDKNFIMDSKLKVKRR
ncbi:hypothetical protein [Maribellus maritimus]|uniref:hypothetical protein n=1 Tax=Maribellus maritimus TaxID=2870838 RepID=UPI001EEB224A|nr:hypothetical protein [Maribellus maritimus]MCG6191497.1 hypothetical protein [Maribellus maritimus]